MINPNSRYCLTVPAMWSDQAKATMREAAIRAGLINRYDHPDRLMLISEPEAAALYCEKKCEQFNLGHGQRFMICDAGGGTVDLIVFEIDDSNGRRSLREVTKGQGDSCGSTFLDAQMREYLKDRFYGLGRVSDSAMESMMENFVEAIKPQFEGDEDQFLLLPATLGLANMDDPANGIEDGNLRITAEDLCEHVFEPVVQKVLDLIDAQVRQSHVLLDAIFLVGGFGQSEYLRRRVIDEFSRRVGFIGVPPRGELAVVRGAVYFGLNPRMVTERVSRRTYGVETRMVFDPRQDPQENCIAGDGDLFAYDGDGAIPRLTTHPQVFKVARFPIKMPKFSGVQKGEPIFMSIKMFFGQTEIKIEVHIRDRVFTFTSAFETLERGLSGIVGDLDVPTTPPRDSIFSSASNSNLSSPNTESRPPSLGHHDSYMSRYARSYNGDDDESFYDGDSRHSTGFHGTAKKLLGPFKIGRRKQ
ncbi:actin-like atpase domain-containing protein [Lichtheimia corymbifera JMRC:FSU:9682]|uniref:Actin-like atpase domain-containing protein n=1 Tax=Lichtheimia corymbifera JMRC:FSU:9682 TaxID=1263082 RepID=A0A068RIF5_9FUNG|nr:actin-like atpase domain-containing protein [Lichtheimia corymbifera JMRC:FSU:9682]